MRVVSPSWLEAAEDVAVVDVRERRDYREVGHVPDAVNVPIDEFRDPASVSAGKLPDPDTLEGLLCEAGIERGDTVVAYDDDGGVGAARFLLTAATFGHEGDILLLDGGFDAWRSQGEVTTDTLDVDPTDYQVTEPGEIVADRETVEAAVDDDTVLVDTRTPAEYNQSHIPGAVQLGWEELLDEEGRLRPEDEIETLLAEKGIERDREIVLYCNTARRLSHTFVVLSHLGYEDVRFYEGSLTDWVRAESPEWDPEGIAATIRERASEGHDAVVDALGEDATNRLKLVGIYATKHEGYFMLRTKVPGGRLTAEQARVIGEVAEEFARAPREYGGSEQNPAFGDAFLDVTTRQDVQMHWIELQDIPEIWDRYEAVGLTTMQACGNSVRNVVGCPADGLGDDAFATGDLVDEITERFLGDGYYANMPRKFKVSVTGCTENCARAQLNDLGLVPARKDGREGFHALVGGGLSDGPRAATDLGVFLEREQVIPLVEAMADVFMQQGNYLDIAVNRLRFLVEEWGTERFRDELERRLSYEFESAGEDLTHDYRGDHVGVHEQANGDRYLGLNVPTGRMLGSEFVTLADLADSYGDGQVRLTLNQNVLLPHVADTDLDDLLTEPLLERYPPDPGPFERGVVTCTGKEFCNYGVIETKTRALRWARDLDEWVLESDQVDRTALPEAIRVHMSGCSASCAQPQVGDVGLRGERFRDDHEEVPATDVGLGGDLSADEFVDWVAGSVPIAEVPTAIKRAVLTYVQERADGESFGEWTRHRSIPELREVVADGPEPTPEQATIEEVS